MSLLLLWIVVFALCGLAGSGAVGGPRRLLLVAMALVAPAVILKDSVVAKAPAREPRPKLR